MIPLFTEVPSGGHPVAFHPQTDYVMRGLKQTVQMVVNYYRQNQLSSPPNQFLVRLLQTFDVDLSLPLERYYSYVDAKALNMSMAFKMTSSIYKGSAFVGNFYAAPTVEYLVADDSPINADDVNRNWQSVQAVTVLMHPKSDLHCVLPAAIPYSLESGLAVILIHLPALAIQYRAFRLTQVGNPNGEESTHMFIQRYVLPNMLASQLEVALFNRLYRRVEGESAPYPVNGHAKHPFMLPFPDGKVDNVLASVVDRYAQIDPVFEKILRNTPAVYEQDALEAFQLPKLAMTGQVEWLMVAARLKFYDFLVKVAGSGALRANQLEVSQLQRAFRDPDVRGQIERIPFEAGEALSSYVSAVGNLAKTVGL